MMDPEPQDRRPDPDDHEPGDVNLSEAVFPMPGADDDDEASSGTTAWDLEDPQADEVPEEHPTI